MPFVLRTIRHGRVKIGRKWYRPSQHHPESKGSVEYDGRLDGLRYVFGRYRRYGDSNNPYEPFVELWGTEAAYRGEEAVMEGPEVVSGYLPWASWREEMP